MVVSVALATAVLKPSSSQAGILFGFPADLWIAWVFLVAGLMTFVVTLKSDRKDMVKWVPIVIGVVRVGARHHHQQAGLACKGAPGLRTIEQPATIGACAPE